MFDKTKLKEIILEYKNDLKNNRWKNEKFKWEAIKCFQENWDIETDNFVEMLKKSLGQTKNLLSSNKFYPLDMIIKFADREPNTVRSMFAVLFDENKELGTRIDNFKKSSEHLKNKYYKKNEQHFQSDKSISTYLWLRYPNKYYIYQFHIAKSLGKDLGYNYKFKQGDSINNISNSFSLYDEICKELQLDKELMNIVSSVLKNEPNCYQDPCLKTLTIDLIFFIYEKIKPTEKTTEFYPNDYTPQLSIDDWKDLLQDEQIFTISSLEIMKRIVDFGGQATCTQLSKKYGEDINFYNAGSSSLAQRIAKKTKCPIWHDINNKEKWWPILYLGREATKDEEGTFVWKLRDELFSALAYIDLSKIQLHANTSRSNKVKNEESSQIRYWFLSGSPLIWSMDNMPIGDTEYYTLYSESGSPRRVFKNFLDAKKGDKVIGYESTPSKQIVALMEVFTEQDGEKIYFKKLERLSSPINFSTLKDVSELKHMEFFKTPFGCLFKLTKDEYDVIMDLIREKNPKPIPSITNPSYTKSDFLNEVYIDEFKYDRLVSVLRKKKNIILQGAPGVGKTFIAERLAYSIMGEKDKERIEFVQFHQNYSYEDFMMGYKPVEDGFELRYGIFYRFCQKAANHPDKEFFFIIDEINRGNMSKIFGELLMLIESEYRNKPITLAYNGLSFSIPLNLHIIGMMNTADRSLAMIDYALRRRFSFFDIEPGFDSDGFVKYLKEQNNENFEKLINCIKELNEEILNDKSLGKGFCIGHSYFCNTEKFTKEWMLDVIDFDVMPMLAEYWFDDADKVQSWHKKLHGILE